MDTENDNSPRFGNRYGITKLKDDNYPNWSFQCQMVLSHYKVWKVVSGEHPRPPTIESREHAYAEEAQQKIAEQLSLVGSDENAMKKARNLRVHLTDTERNKFQKELDECDERNEEALRIICFTVSDLLQGPIRQGQTSKGAWDELKQFYAPNNRQRKHALLQRLYRLEMGPNANLIEHE
jgi:hypothetical protein